jgi:hypothetical protein
LINDLAFTYDDDFVALRNALATIPLASTNLTDNVTSILSWDERDSLLDTASMVIHAGGKIERRQNSSIPTRDIRHIYDSIVTPALEIGVGSNRILAKLEYYPRRRHDSSKWYETELRAETFEWHRPTTWLWWGNQEWLANVLVSDDVLIERIAPNEETKLLIGSVIARAGDQYLWSWSDISLMERRISVRHVGTLVLQNVMRKTK